MKHPRLLLIAASNFNHLSGGGITFTNLFHGWPRDRIAVLTNDPIPPTTDVCGRFYFLSQGELPWVFPFSLASVLGGQEKMERALKDAKGSATEKKSPPKSQNLLRRVLPLFQRLIGDEIPTRVRISPQLKEWIDDFRPDAIYTILGNLPQMRLVEKITQQWHLPYAVHMMDDWPAMLYRRGILGPYQRWRMRTLLKELFDGAAARLAICPAMAQAYEKRYGHKFLAFHNALDADGWLQKARTDWKRGTPFVIVYAGALMENSQLASVRDAADAVEILAREGLDVQLRIYAPWYASQRYRADLEQPGAVEVFDAPKTMDIESLFAKADLLLLPVNFDAKSVRYIRYSMPTKVPAYMFSGTPTLAYGPEEVASIEYAQQWALIVGQRRPEELAAAIRKCAADEALRKRYGLAAQELAKKNHDRARVSKAFQQVLIEMAARPPLPS